MTRTSNIAERAPKNREGSGAQAFSWGCIVMTNMAWQPGVCPKRHAKLPATVLKPWNCR
jgi:hypothetical protein